MIVLKKIKHLLFLSMLMIKRICRVILNKPFVHVFGDSHTLLFQHELFTIHHVGPATAYKLTFPVSTTEGRKKVFTVLSRLARKRKHIFLFVFGEIDCRIHINKTSKKMNISLDNAIEKTITSYGKFLMEIKTMFPQSKIMVLNVFPAGEEKNIYNVEDYPTREQHLVIVKKFNQQLKTFCQNNKMIFLSVFDQLLDKRDRRIKEYIFDPVHYNRKILPYIIKAIKDNNIDL